MLFTSGVNEEDIVFQLLDRNIHYETMLEDVSNILSNGEVPNLFDKIKIKIPESLEKIKYNEVKRGDVILLMNKKLQEAGVRNADAAMAWNKFILNIKSHLHFILVQSPSGDSLKNRLRS